MPQKPESQVSMFLAAGEAICFGLDSIAVPYVKEAGTIFAFYATGIIIFIYLAAYHITETEYFADEEGVVIPKHVVEEHPEILAKVDQGDPEAGLQSDGIVRHYEKDGTLSNADQVGQLPM